MTKDEFKKYWFSTRLHLSQGKRCDASWQVQSIGGAGYAISCRVCGTQLQSNFTPRCLRDVKDEETGLPYISDDLS